VASATKARAADGGQPSTPRLRRLLGYVRPYAALVALAIVLTAALGAGRYARAYLMKPILDDVLLPQQALAEAPASASWLLPDALARARPRPAAAADAEPSRGALAEQLRASLVRIVVAALVLIVAIPLLLFARTSAVEWVLGRVHVDIARDVCARLLALPLAYHTGRARGDVLARMSLDVAASQRAVKLLFGDLVESLLMIAIGGAFLFAISWQLAALSLVAGPALFAVLARSSRRIEQSARRRQEKAGDVTGRMLEMLAGIKVIKAFRAEAAENAAFRRETGALFRRGMRVVRHRVAARSLVEALNNGVAIGLLLLGVALVLDRRFGLSAGDLAAFALVLSTTYRPLRSLAGGVAELVDARPSVERFAAILDAEPEAPDPPGARRLDGVHRAVAFEDVHFGYGEADVLRGVDLRVRAGEVVALVGRTGAGKTTLVDLLLRFHDPRSGRITIDGVDLRQIARDDLLARIAVVGQDAFLFDGSIRDNIRFGRPEASDAEVLAAARAAHVDEFARALPGGYDAPVGSGGVRLSGGQRQRITIARALLRDPAILILDEATSALDAKSEVLVQDAIERLLQGRTVFLIAHRIATLRRADRIAVLEGGRVSQSGTHGELLRDGGLYRELFDLQRVAPPVH
jgi:ABC-type multidrug transport system fused ATPase/permease subunit